MSPLEAPVLLNRQKAKSMFPALLEEVGWNQDANCVPGGKIISLADSAPLDTFPFLLSFMNYWLKTAETTVIFVSFKTAQARLSSVFRKIYGLQLNMLTAQSRFYFIDGVSHDAEEVLQRLKAALKPTKTLLILEGFAFAGDLPTCIKIHSFIEHLCTSASLQLTALFQWSRTLEADYRGRSEVIREDLDCGGQGWLYLLERSHFIFCARPLRSGATKEVAGELVAALGPRAQEFTSPFNFYPITTLYRIPTDTSIQLISKGFMK